MNTNGEINEESVERVRHKHIPAVTVKSHTDADTWPNDASYHFDELMNMMDKFKK